jgi:hypothetical protein
MPRYAHILPGLALFVALGGTAHATQAQDASRFQAGTARALDVGVSTGWEGTSAVRSNRP